MLLTKIKYCFTILFIFCINHADAQLTLIDSLKQLLAAAKEDTVKIDLAYQLKNAYSDNNLDSMVFYSRQTIRLLHHALASEKADSTKLKILSGIRSMYQYVSNDSMLFYAQQGVQLTIKNRNDFPDGTEARALTSLGFVLCLVGNYPDSKETHLKALKIAESVADPMLIANIYNGIAAVNKYAGDYRQAIYYYNKAENLTKNIPGSGELGEALIGKGTSYEQLGILDSAYSYIQEVLALQFRKYHGKDKTGSVHSEMGIIYSKMGKEQLAVAFFRQSLQLNSKSGNIRLLALSYCKYAEHLDRYNHADSAIYYATKALLLNRQFHLLVQQLEVSTLLSKLYKQENKIDSAFKYQQLMIDTRDILFNREKTNRLQTLEFNEQLRQQELESAKKKSEEERKQNIQYALIAAGLAIIIIMFLFLSRSFITNARLIEFFGVIALLLVFEFLNLFLHPYIERITNHSPILMLLALVGIASLLVPLHHKLEKWATVKLVEKNKATRLANAKKTIEMLEDKSVNTQEVNTND
jgi:tetratricopeptide (TPR) repeat protein